MKDTDVATVERPGWMGRLFEDLEPGDLNDHPQNRPDESSLPAVASAPAGEPAGDTRSVL